jgi:hypothetical protein
MATPTYGATIGAAGSYKNVYDERTGTTRRVPVYNTGTGGNIITQETLAQQAGIPAHLAPYYIGTTGSASDRYNQALARYNQAQQSAQGQVAGAGGGSASGSVGGTFTSQMPVNFDMSQAIAEYKKWAEATGQQAGEQAAQEAAVGMGLGAAGLTSQIMNDARARALQAASPGLVNLLSRQPELALEAYKIQQMFSQQEKDRAAQAAAQTYADLARRSEMTKAVTGGGGGSGTGGTFGVTFSDMGLPTQQRQGTMDPMSATMTELVAALSNTQLAVKYGGLQAVKAAIDAKNAEAEQRRREMFTGERLAAGSSLYSPYLF